MIQNKQNYTSPSTDVLELRPEGMVCQSLENTTIPNWGDGTDFPIAF